MKGYGLLILNTPERIRHRWIGPPHRPRTRPPGGSFSLRSFGSMDWTSAGVGSGRRFGSFSIRSFGSMDWTGSTGARYFRSRLFQYPLFRIDGLDAILAALDHVVALFQYPLFRIDGLDTWPRSWLSRLSGCFSIRSFGSMDWTKWPSDISESKKPFQYPLFRIDGLDTITMIGWDRLSEVSVSALSDRWIGPAIGCALGQSLPVSVSALSDRWIGRDIIHRHIFRFRGFSIRSFGSMDWTNRIKRQALDAQKFQYPLFRIDGLDALSLLS